MLDAQMSGRAGKLPVKVRLVRDFKNLRDCQVSCEVFGGRLELME